MEREVHKALLQGPASGGRILERLQAEGVAGLRGRAALVYGALANLRARGTALPLLRAEGEEIWGVDAAVPPPPPRPPGPPPSFSFGPAERAFLDGALARITIGLAPHFFEELRRVVIADADRRVFHGERQPRAAELALRELGHPVPVRRMLRAAERGTAVRLSMRKPRGRIVAALLACGLALAAVRLFLIGVYAVQWSSMAPALEPADEGGDAWVLVWLRAYDSRRPRRGDIVVFRPPEGGGSYVKRAMGLPGETLGIGGGDLHVNGKRLVKERALLDRLRVPLFGQADFRLTGRPDRWEQPAPLHRGRRHADGSVEGEAGAPTPEAVVRARVRATARPCTITLVLDEGSPGGRNTHTVVLRTSGPGMGVSTGGREIATGESFLLEPGVWREVWISNADHLLRVELDGVEVASAPLETYGPAARCSLEASGQRAEVEGLEAARDVYYEQSPTAPGSTVVLRKDELFLLGDNSPHSRDSRHFGPVETRAVLGRAFFVAWPFSRIRSLD
ncbi:MAG: signal peptidase I [Planctomycetaceae bacterium]